MVVYLDFYSLSSTKSWISTPMMINPSLLDIPPPSQEQPADLWMGAGTILFAELPSQDAFLLSSLKLKTISSLKHLN